MPLRNSIVAGSGDCFDMDQAAADYSSGHFERAIKIDPQNAEAIVGFAYARSRASAFGCTPSPIM
jgi:hypothetical protein